MAGLQALVLDYGEVLSWPQRIETVEAMARRAGVGVDAFRAAYGQHRDSYDAGLPAQEFWRRVLATLGHPPASGSSSLVSWLIQGDVLSWTHYREEIWDLARSFRAAGGRTAMLSNGVPEVMARIRAERPLEPWFDVVVISCEVGSTKPDPHIYQICLSRLGVAAERTLFVDDRAANIDAAAQLGIQTLHFTDERSVRELRERVLRQMNAPRRGSGPQG